MSLNFNIGIMKELNNIDKCIILFAIITGILMILPFIVAYILDALNLKILLGKLFRSIIFIIYFILPICVTTQVITLIVKLFSKNKNKKDWLIIAFNCISVAIFGIFNLLLLAATINTLI